MRWTIVLLFLLISTVGSCTLEPASRKDGFSARARQGQLVLTNHTPIPVHYVALRRGTAALVDLYFDPEKWPSVEPGADKRIAYADLTGYGRGAKQAIVYRWRKDLGQYRRVVVDLG